MGDGLLLEFPSVVNATACSIEVQEGMAARNLDVAEDKRIVFRIGVNLGDIIIEGEDILGDGVNIASRIEATAEPGGISISHRAYEDVRDRLKHPFEDSGEHDFKNIARPVWVWKWAPSNHPGPSTPPARVDTAPPPPSKPSIVVLPFQNMSGDPEQEYFADGMTEDIITELSRFEDLFVIARNTSFVYKDQRVDVKDVARELGVHFVLEGSVRKAGQRVRITAQLINGRDGGHVWAERYDGALEDVFDLQEQVTRQVVGGISPTISEAEIARIDRGESKFDDAHERAWSAQAMMRASLRLTDPQMLDGAIAMAIEAIDMNPRCSIAYQTICLALTMQSIYRWGNDPAAAADLAEDWAMKFQSRFPNSYRVYFCLGMARSHTGQYQAANLDFRRAHELNPNDSLVLSFWARCEAGAGEFENAKTHARMALHLSPKDPYAGVSYLALAMAAFIEKDSANFIEWAGKAIQAHPNAPIRRTMMIAHAADVGDDALLKTHLDVVTRSTPDFIDSLFRGENQLFQQPEHMEFLLAGLRKAGLPK